MGDKDNFITHICAQEKVQPEPSMVDGGGDGGGATGPLPRNGGVEELLRDPTVGARHKVKTRSQKWKK